MIFIVFGCINGYWTSAFLCWHGQNTMIKIPRKCTAGHNELCFAEFAAWIECDDILFV